MKHAHNDLIFAGGRRAYVGVSDCSCCDLLRCCVDDTMFMMTLWPPKGVSKAGLYWSVRCKSRQVVGQTFEEYKIWDAMVFIKGHCNDFNKIFSWLWCQVAHTFWVAAHQNFAWHPSHADYGRFRENYVCCWCPGFLCRQVISGHGIARLG